MGKFEIIYGDIVSDEILALGDAVVNPTNPMMRCGGGVSGAIFRKAGAYVLEDYAERAFGISYFNPPGKNEMQVTEIRITPGFALKKDIIFAQGPKIWDYESYDEAMNLLLQTYKNVVIAAKNAGYESVLIPLLGTGSYGFDPNKTKEEVIPLLENLAEHSNIDIYLVLYAQNNHS